jgi:hypothetical protein
VVNFPLALKSTVNETNARAFLYVTTRAFFISAEPRAASRGFGTREFVSGKRETVRREAASFSAVNRSLWRGLALAFDLVF